MQTIGWLAFGVSNALSKTCMHFFPSARNVTAPYPAACSIRSFLPGKPPKTILIEGGRLGAPDGLWLQDAFPELNEEVPGIFGIGFEISCSQPRVDLSDSSCVIEIASKIWSCRFRLIHQRHEAAAVLGHAGGQGQPADSSLAVGQIVADRFLSTSLVAINSFSTPLTIAFRSAATEQGARSLHVDPFSCSEFTLGDDALSGGLEQDCSWGKLKTRNVVFSWEKGRDSEGHTGGQASLYLLYRDVESKRVMSVTPLQEMYEHSGV